MIDDYTLFPTAPCQEDWRADRSGVVAAFDAERLGRAAAILGAGRHRADAEVDPSVGIDIVAPVGTTVSAGDPILHLSMGRSGHLDEVRALLSGAVTIADRGPEASPLVLEVIVGSSR